MAESITTTLGLLKTTSDVIKEALDFAKKAKNAELAEKLINLYQDFISLSEANQELRLQNKELAERITEMNKRQDIAHRLRFVNLEGIYYLKKDDGSEDGPFCGVCWDVDGMLVHKSRAGGIHLSCEYCSKARSRR